MQGIQLPEAISQKIWIFLYQLKKEIYICLIMQKIVDILTSVRRLTWTATFTITTL